MAAGFFYTLVNKLPIQALSLQLVTPKHTYKHLYIHLEDKLFQKKIVCLFSLLPLLLLLFNSYHSTLHLVLCTKQLRPQLKLSFLLSNQSLCSASQTGKQANHKKAYLQKTIRKQGFELYIYVGVAIKYLITCQAYLRG